MPHTCEDCGDTFEILASLRLHDCPEDEDAAAMRATERAWIQTDLDSEGIAGTDDRPASGALISDDSSYIRATRTTEYGTYPRPSSAHAFRSTPTFPVR